MFIFNQLIKVRGITCDLAIVYWLETKAEITLAPLASGYSNSADQSQVLANYSYVLLHMCTN